MPAVLLVRALLAATLLTLLARPTLGQDTKQHQRVYQYVVQSAVGSLDSVEEAVAAAVSSAGWKVLATVDAGVPDGCSYRARVIALYHPEYVDRLMSINRHTGPFAVVDRINIFEDETGLHVAVVNPNSVVRTVLMDDEAYVDVAETHLQALRSLITSSVEGTISTEGYGQKRKRGYIGKTMGVMAGGRFDDKIQDKLEVPGGDVMDVAAKVREGLSEEGSKWGFRLTYELPLPEFDTVIFGSTGAAMESKSFSIVKAGSNSARKKYAYPGLAHAAAYPIEVVVTKDADVVRVQFVDAMYRMKMYFEDAGKAAFMKNMRMPGSLADELRDQIRLRFDEPAK